MQQARDRARQEKVELTERFEKEIESVGVLANQAHAQAGNAITALRAEISPLRRELSPLRRQVATQEIEIAQKDAEIAQLRKVLAGRQLKKVSHSREEKMQRRLKALQRAAQKNS